jgi:hypothetical protein
VVLKALDNRKAISGVTAPFSLIILDMVFLDTPNFKAISVTETANGLR